MHKSDFIICEVESYGNTIEYEDEYYGYYDLYVADKLKIKRILNRKEIINYGLNLLEYRLIRFVSTFKLISSEINLFYGKYTNIDKYIEYYQLGNHDVFNVNLETKGKRK